MVLTLLSLISFVFGFISRNSILFISNFTHKLAL